MRRHPLALFAVAASAAGVLAFTAVPTPLPPRGGGAEALPAPVRTETCFDAAVRGLASPDAGVRRTSVRVLGALGDRRAVSHVLPLRDAPDALLAREATLALVRLTGDADAVRSLAATALEDPSAVAAIEACPGEAADAELVALAGPRDPYVRGAALRSLARRSPETALPLLRDALTSPDAPLRFLALQAAIPLADPSLVPAFRALVAAGDHAERRLALAALVRCGEPGAREELLRTVDEARRTGDVWVEVLAAEALALAGTAEAPRLWGRAVDALAPADRAAAVSRLRTGFPPVLRDALRGLLADDDLDVRLATALALGGAGDRAAADVLRRDAPRAGRDVAADCAVVLASLGVR